MLMDINLISPYVRRAMRSLLPANYKIGQRIILDYEIIYLESGEMRLYYDGVDYSCRAGDIIFIRPGKKHRIETLSSIVSQPHIHFDMSYSAAQSEKRFICFKDIPDLSAEDRALISKDIIKGEHPPVISAAGRGLAESLYRIIDLYKKRDIASQLECKAELTKMIGVLLSAFGETASPKKVEPLPLMIKQFIESNITEKITLDQLAAHFHYNKFYIEKKFREENGVPISKYYNSLRLSAIKEFLADGHSVTETAGAFGFESIYTFSRYFKNACGISPSGYAKKKELQE